MKSLPENILSKMSPSDRKKIGQMSKAEAEAKYANRTELAQHKILSAWLFKQEREGRLTWNHAATHKKSTMRVGWPDFSVYIKGVASFFELKCRDVKLSIEQRCFEERLRKQGFSYYICYSAEEAINLIRYKLGRDTPIGNQGL